MLDVLVVAPCTGNTLSKMANGVNDTSVTMAAKAHLRNLKPVVVAVSTNDGLGANAKNIGLLLNTKNVYFVPFRQDDAISKENSLIADMSLIIPSLEAAINGKQLQPVLIQ
jgi:dipicolinate synthase subunit B